MSLTYHKWGYSFTAEALIRLIQHKGPWEGKLPTAKSRYKSNAARIAASKHSVSAQIIRDLKKK